MLSIALARLWGLRAALSNLRSLPAEKRPTKIDPMTVFTPDGALEFISMDVLGPLPTSRNGHRYILVITDRFYKMTVAVPMADQTAYTVAHALIDRWVACFGIPIVLLSDNGSNSASPLWRS